jgi:hypothetical protein
MQVTNQDGWLRRAQMRFRDPLLTALTILLLLLIFVIAPLHAANITYSQDYGFALTFTLVGVILIISGNAVAVIAMLIAIGLAITATTLSSRADSNLAIHLYAAAWVTVGIPLLWVVARSVFAPGRVTYHRIIGAILLYLTIGLVFVGLFAMVGLFAPAAFSGIKISDSPALASKLIYFSFVTLTSTGYGDIVPIHPFARSLCNVEAIIGQLYPATLLARLVTLELETRRHRKE